MPRLALYLITRGLFLVILELTIINFVWIPDPTRNIILLQVIWASGWSMILMSVFFCLPKVTVGLIGIMGILCHPMLVKFPVSVNVISQDLLFLLLGGDQQTMSAGNTTY